MKAEILQAQRELIQGYYIRIGMNPQITVEDIMQLLEGDLNYIIQEQTLLEAETILNEVNEPHEVSGVTCHICGHEWVAVRPLGTLELECPNCSGFTSPVPPEAESPTAAPPELNQP